MERLEYTQGATSPAGADAFAVEPDALQPESDPPAAAWPPQGAVTFDGLKYQYPGLPLALRGVDAAVEPGEDRRVRAHGVGQEPLLVALFRLVEAAGGRVLVGGVGVTRSGCRRWSGSPSSRRIRALRRHGPEQPGPVRRAGRRGAVGGAGGGAA